MAHVGEHLSEWVWKRRVVTKAAIANCRDAQHDWFSTVKYKGLIYNPGSIRIQMHHTEISTFLFAWNPVKFAWPEIAEQRKRLGLGEKVIEDWSCASHKKIKEGDRAFIVTVGPAPRGIFASGHIASQPFIGKDQRRKDNYRVLIDFDELLDPGREQILSLDLLKMGGMEKQQWAPQASGILIKPFITEELEVLWQDFLHTMRGTL